MKQWPQSLQLLLKQLFFTLILCLLPFRWIRKSLGPEQLVLQYSQRGLGGFAIGLRTEMSMMGIELGASTRPGDDSRKLAGVLGVETASPPSPSLPMAESSINNNFLLRRSTTKNVLESGMKRKRKKRRKFANFLNEHRYWARAIDWARWVVGAGRKAN